MTENGKISSQLMVVSNADSLLITHVTELEKQQAKMEQHSRRNNVEISGISNEVSDENLEKKSDRHLQRIRYRFESPLYRGLS